MNLLEFGKPLGTKDPGASRVARGSRPVTSYDSRAGSAILRRAGKTSEQSAPLRGDQASRLLSSRRKEAAATDQLGRELTEFYASVLRQPIPERILALVDSLAAQETR